jgi:hypothetical protein
LDSTQLKVPKHRAAVEVAVPGRVLQVELFLSDYAREHLGPERVSDILNGENDFLPAVAEDERVVLLGRETFLWVRIPLNEHTEEEDEAGQRTDIGVRVLLEDGSGLTGNIRFVPPPGRGRLQDYLNSSGRFLSVVSGDKVFYVNRLRIANVVAVE